MSTLLGWPDFEAATNSTLSDPEGRDLADTLATSILAWSARYCNRLSWEHGTYTEVLSPTDPMDTFYLSALPLDPCPGREIYPCGCPGREVHPSDAAEVPALTCAETPAALQALPDGAATRSYIPSNVPPTQEEPFMPAPLLHRLAMLGRAAARGQRRRLPKSNAVLARCSRAE